VLFVCLLYRARDINKQIVTAADCKLAHVSDNDVHTCDTVNTVGNDRQHICSENYIADKAVAVAVAVAVTVVVV
jgi:hypothetical protein